MRILHLPTILVAAAVLTTGVARAESEPKQPVDRAWLEQKLQTCASCHGKNGAEPIAPNYPIIAGQHASYLEYSLKGYRDGTRNNAIMSGQAQGLSDAQIEALAKYFSRQESPLHVPSLKR